MVESSLEELVGEFLSLAEQGAAERFGLPLPHDPSLPVPEAIVAEIRKTLTESLQGLKHHAATLSIDSFLSSYGALCDAIERFAILQREDVILSHQTILAYTNIPRRLLNAKQGEIRVTTKRYQRELSDAFAYHRRQIRADTPIPLVCEERKHLDQLLAQYEQLVRIGAHVDLSLTDAKMLQYMEHRQQIAALHEREFAPIVRAYCDSRWERAEDLQYFRTKILALIPQYLPRGFAKLFSSDLFPEYVAEVERFSSELDVHINHYADVQRLAQRLRSGIAVPSSCPDEFRQLRYLAPLLAEAAKRESETAQREPRFTPTFELPGSFPALPQPPKTVHPQLSTAYACLTYPIGWMDRLDKFANSLAGLPTEICTTADLQYCLSLRSYLRAVGGTPFFTTARDQFPTLAQNYRNGMEQVERLCAT